MVLIARRNCHGKIAANGTRQIVLDFMVPGNGCRLHETAHSLPEDDRAMPGVSCQRKFRGFRFWIETENFLPFDFQNERNSFPQIAETFFLRLARPIRAGNFETSRPETAFVWFATVNNGCEVFHVKTFKSLWPKMENIFFTSLAEATPIACGRLGIVMYDGTVKPAQMAAAKPLQTWVFDAQKLRALIQRTSIGAGYRFALAWGENKPTQNRVTIIARYLSENGAEVLSAPGIVPLTTN